MNERLRFPLRVEEGRIIVTNPGELDDLGQQVATLSIDTSTPRTSDEVLERVSEAPCLKDLSEAEKAELASAILGLAS